jgi:glycosyltransferase involved in cell wall biosynthesis
VRQTGAPIRVSGFLNQSEIARAYAAADVLVVPSVWETWGLVVNEAMACGLAALVSDGVACAEALVQPGVTGDVFPVGRADVLGRFIAALAADPDAATRQGAAARRRVERCDVSQAVAGTVRALRAVTSTGRPSGRSAAHAASGSTAR